MRLFAIAISLVALVGCGRLNPMNPDYEWDGDQWQGDSGDTGFPAEAAE